MIHSASISLSISTWTFSYFASPLKFLMMMTRRVIARTHTHGGWLTCWCWFSARRVNFGGRGKSQVDFYLKKRWIEKKRRMWQGTGANHEDKWHLSLVDCTVYLAPLERAAVGLWTFLAFVDLKRKELQMLGGMKEKRRLAWCGGRLSFSRRPQILKIGFPWQAVRSRLSRFLGIVTHRPALRIYIRSTRSSLSISDIPRL